MRVIRKRKGLSKKRMMGMGLIVLSFSFLGLYLGGFAYMYLDMSSYNSELDETYWWDSKDCFYTGPRGFKDAHANANWDFLESHAYTYETWTDEYNIAREEWDCASTIVNAYFEKGIPSPYSNYSGYSKAFEDFKGNENSKYRILRSKNPYGAYGDSPIWTGTYVASLAFHYGEACEEKDVSEVNEVLNKMISPVNGLHVLTHVSGLEGNLARWAVKDTPKNRERFEGYFYKHEDGKLVKKEANLEDRRYPGQGNYSDWIYEDDTSRDQHIGYFMGYGIAYKILTETDAPTGINLSLKQKIVQTIKQDCLEVLDRLLGSGWDVIAGESKKGEGRGNDGASFYPRFPWEGGGTYLLAYTSLGKMMNPQKYTKYHEEAVNKYLTTSYHFTVAQQSSSYFGNNLAMEGFLLQYFLEEDLDLKEKIRYQFNKFFYKNVQYHRNCWFNLGYLIINELELDEILQNDRLTYRLDDIVDNMRRFAEWRFPAREWHVPVPEDAEDLVHPKRDTYADVFNEESSHPLNMLYGALIRELADTERKSRVALGIDELKATGFAWQSSPFSLTGNFPENENALGYEQNPGVDFLVCYWLGRYYGYFNS